MTKAIVLRRYGEADALELEDADVAPPAAGELLIRKTAIGVNFHHVYVGRGSTRRCRCLAFRGLGQ